MQIHTDTHVHNSRDWRTVERNSNREGFIIVSSRKQTKSVFTNRKKPSWVAAAAQQQRQQTQQRPRRRLVSVHSLLSLSLSALLPPTAGAQLQRCLLRLQLLSLNAVRFVVVLFFSLFLRPVLKCLHIAFELSLVFFFPPLIF